MNYIHLPVVVICSLILIFEVLITAFTGKNSMGDML